VRTKKVTRHYCDHCSKGMFRKDAMERHEAICYLNPARKCLRCDNQPEFAITEERRKAILEDGEKCQTKEGECPDCLMAMMIQFNTQKPSNYEPEDPFLRYNKEQFQSDRMDWDTEHQDTHWRYM
jgi:hypothetical protein